MKSTRVFILVIATLMIWGVYYMMTKITMEAMTLKYHWTVICTGIIAQLGFIAFICKYAKKWFKHMKDWKWNKK